MYARVVTVSVPPDKVDESISIYQSIEPLFQHQKGFKSANLLLDRNTGKCVSISNWETRADLEASESWYQEQMARFGPIFAMRPVREIYEVGAEVGAAKELGGA